MGVAAAAAPAAAAGSLGSVGGTLADASVDSEDDGWGAISVCWDTGGAGSSIAGVAVGSVAAAASLSGGCGSAAGPAIDGAVSGWVGDLSEFMIGGASSLACSSVGRASGCGSGDFCRTAIVAARSGGHIALFAYGGT